MKSGKYKNLKVNFMMPVVLVLHFLLFLFLKYCDRHVYMGIVGELPIFLVIYFPIMIISAMMRGKNENDSDQEMCIHENTKLPNRSKESRKKVIWFFVSVAFSIIMLIVYVKYILIRDPFAFRVYVGLIMLFAIGLIFFVFRQNCDERIYYCLQMLITDIAVIVSFVVFIAVLQPVSVKQAYRLAGEAGYSDLILQAHGNENNFSSYFGELDFVMETKIETYFSNTLSFPLGDISHNEDKLGYYFFVGTKDGELWGIAVSEKTGRVVRQISITNPFIPKEEGK